MGKGDPKTKPKQAPKGVPDLEQSKPRQPNGQHRKRNDAPADPRKVALVARCIQMGVEPTKQRRYQMASQHLEHPLGRVMAFRCSAQELSRLWKTWQGLQSARHAYETRVLGVSSHPKGMKLEMMPERIETDSGHTVDVRSRDERDEAAKRNWELWTERLAELPERDIALLLDRGGPTLFSTQWRQPTAAGLATLEALKSLHRVCTGKRG